MPPTQQCPLGAANKAKIEGLDDRITDFEGRVVRYMDHTDKCIEKLTNHFSKRLAPGVTIAIVGLSNLATALLIWIITHNFS